MLTNDSVGSNRALKRYSRHRRQRTDCCYKRAAERRSLSRPCRPSKYLAALTCTDRARPRKVWPHAVMFSPRSQIAQCKNRKAQKHYERCSASASCHRLRPFAAGPDAISRLSIACQRPPLQPRDGIGEGYVSINFYRICEAPIAASRQANFAPPPGPKWIAPTQAAEQSNNK